MSGHGVTVLLPARDEAASVGEVVRGCILHTPELDEVLVIDDGSADDTASVARAAGARVVSLARSRGKGAALREGATRARSERIVLLDADGQDDPADIPRLLAALPRADLVVGSRFLGRFEDDAITAIDRLGNRALTALVNALFRTELTDTQAGFRAARRDALTGAIGRADRYDVEVQVLLAVLACGGTVVEVPVTRRPRVHGASKLDRLRDGSRILGRILAARFTGRAARSESDRLRR